jgi:acyl-CoA synthetase (AMP-forming)/AMP-acid ligase II
MLYSTIISPFIRQTEKHSDTTVARIDGQVYSYAQLAQRIAPIMNELDALSLQRVGIVMKQDLTAYAALLACLFNGVVAVPLPCEMPEEELAHIAQELELHQILTIERMHYYFRMTFEDALCRIDNGLYHIEDEQLVSIVPHKREDGTFVFRNIYAKDFKASKPFTITTVFQTFTPEFPEICSIF